MVSHTLSEIQTYFRQLTYARTSWNTQTKSPLTMPSVVHLINCISTGFHHPCSLEAHLLSLSPLQRFHMKLLSCILLYSALSFCQVFFQILRQFCTNCRIFSGSFPGLSSYSTPEETSTPSGQSAAASLTFPA